MTFTSDNSTPNHTRAFDNFLRGEVLNSGERLNCWSSNKITTSFFHTLSPLYNLTKLQGGKKWQI